MYDSLITDNDFHNDDLLAGLYIMSLLEKYLEPQRIRSRLELVDLASTVWLFSRLAGEFCDHSLDYWCRALSDYMEANDLYYEQLQETDPYELLKELLKNSQSDNYA